MSSSLRLRALTAALLIAPALLMSGCATVSGTETAEGETPRVRNRDPLEPFNRSMFEFNDLLDRAVLKPVAQTYERAIHPGFRGLVTNFFSNLRDVWTAGNQLLQGKPWLATQDLARFALNSTLGFGGIADIATPIGLAKHHEDFGQTLGVWGVPPGPYVVLPFFGPGSVRDTAAWAAADVWADPLLAIDSAGQRNNLYALRIIDTRAQFISAGDLLETAALDRYSFMRDAWMQRRRSQVYDGNPPHDPDEPANPYGEVEDLPIAPATGGKNEPAAVPPSIIRGVKIR